MSDSENFLCDLLTLHGFSGRNFVRGVICTLSVIKLDVHHISCNITKTRSHLSGFLPEKNLRGGAKEINHCFFKTLGYCSYCSFYCFRKFYGGKRLLGGEVILGAPPAPCSKKPASFVQSKAYSCYKIKQMTEEIEKLRLGFRRRTIWKLTKENEKKLSH